MLVAEIYTPMNKNFVNVDQIWEIKNVSAPWPSIKSEIELVGT